MKRLTITYNGIPLFDGDVDEMAWTDTTQGVTVQGKIKRPTPPTKNLLSMLTTPNEPQP